MYSTASPRGSPKISSCILRKFIKYQAVQASLKGVGENGLFGFKGELTLRDANGEDLVLFNLPMCYDQTYLSEKYGKTTRPILGEYVYQIVGNELHLTTVVPASWILDDARVFPVVIDPTASSYQGGIYPFERYNYGCSYTVGVNVPAGTITGWYAQWQVTATGEVGCPKAYPKSV